MPSLNKINQMLRYDEASGKLIRRVNAPPKGKAGDVIEGSSLSIGGRAYNTSKLIWFIKTKQFPNKEIVFIDGDSTNTRFSNMELKVY